MAGEISVDEHGCRYFNDVWLAWHFLRLADVLQDRVLRGQFVQCVMESIGFMTLKLSMFSSI